MAHDTHRNVMAELAAPFPPSQVEWRVGSTTGGEDKKRGMALAYLNARTVADRFNEVFGMLWQCRYSHAGPRCICEIGLYAAGEWYWRADGAGDTDVEAEKGGLSDAFKRAAVRWNVGRYLYDMDAPWVDIERSGRSYRIKPGALVDLRNKAARPFFAWLMDDLRAAPDRSAWVAKNKDLIDELPPQGQDRLMREAQAVMEKAA